MSSIKMTIPITPAPKASVRLARQGWYNPSAKGMGIVRRFAELYMRERHLTTLKGPLLVITHYRIPAALSQRVAHRFDQHLCPHAKKPDGDNLEKFLNDALKGVVWDDDACISVLLRTKSKTLKKVGSTTIFAIEIPDEPLCFEKILEIIQTNLNFEEDDE
jgi:Holliday junction resolvase RusA-like endonuclease